MNKKFSTFLVGALLTSSVGAFAQTIVRTQENKVGNGIKLRPTATASATFGSGISKFDTDKAYQLVNGNEVLIQSRNYTTGEVTVAFKAVTAAPINASLWKIEVSGDAVSGYAFKYVNVETNLPLAFDWDKADKYDATYSATGKPGSIIEDCQNQWNWYRQKELSTGTFGDQQIYTYREDSVLVLAKTGGNGLRAVKMDNSQLGAWGNGITLKPVIAGAITLTAADLNNMVDFQYASATNGINFSLKNSTPSEDGGFTGTTFKAIAANATSGLPTGFSTANFNATASDYVLLEEKSTTTPKKYFMVDTTFYRENDAPSKTYLKVAVNKFETIAGATLLTDANLSSRYAFKFTYYPSNDSLAMQVAKYGALKYSDSFKEAGYKWNTTATLPANHWDAVSMTNAEADQMVLRLINLDDNSTAVTFETAYKYPAPSTVSTVFTKLNFANRTFTYLNRATLPAEGLFFIKEVKSGKNVVCNFEGTMMLDAETAAQNYNDMPATMWVAQYTGCSTSQITNREYAKSAPVFAGQWYINEDGEYYFINQNYTGFAANELDYMYNYVIDPVKKETDSEKAAWGDLRHGYQNIETADLLVKKFYLAYNLFTDKDLYLNVTEKKSFAPSEDAASYYELEEVADAKDVAFGTGAGVAGLPQLKRTAYALKVKDYNLVDNDKVYVYLVQKYGKTPYYQALTLDEKAALEAENATVKKAYFYMKADQTRKDDIAYVLIDINKGSELATGNGYVQAHCEDAVGELSFLGLDNTAEERASAFVLKDTGISLYRSIEAGKTANIYLKRGTSKEYLFEDMSNHASAPSYVKELGYLGLTAEGVQPSDGCTTAMYVQAVKSTVDKVMPQYLFAVDTVTVADGKWCDSGEHGYIKPGDAHSDHTTDYTGYLAGRFLVNLSDTIAAHGKNTNMLHKADAYKYFGYDRLGFVEAIYRVEGDKEYLYILKDGNTLASVQKKYGVVDRDDFSATSKVFDRKELTGKHANYVFSLRLIDEKEDDFLIESNAEGSDVASFKGAWVKVHNTCPVLAKFTTESGDHKDETGNIQELISNAQIFNIEEGLDEIATDNDQIDVPTAISVVAGNGSVTVKGAAGKNVVISNVLGQKIATTAISSDEATITVPAGIVFVAVEGEAAVKAIVK